MDVAVEVDLVVDLFGGGGDRPADGDVVPVVELGQALQIDVTDARRNPSGPINQ